MRDNRKSEEYFKVYLQEIDQNISEYSELFKKIPTENQHGKISCLGYIAHLYRNKLVAIYSAGFSLSEIQEQFQHCIETTMESIDDNQSYHPVLEILALAVLLNYDKIDVIHNILRKTGIENKLTDTFVHHLDKDWPIVENTDWCPWYAEFLQCSLECRSIFIQQYLSKKWYRNHKNDDWYNSHNAKNYNGYTGYWAFEIAAISKIFDIPDSRDWPYYPYDMLHQIN